jgi:hypothetical protein
MRVLGLVSFKVYPAHMGGQKGVTLFYDHLARHLDVSLAVSRDNRGLADAAYPVHSLLYPNRQMAKNGVLLKQLESIIRSEKINCLIAEHSYTGWLAYLLGKRTGLPFIVHSHNREAQRFKLMQRSWWKAYDRYEAWVHRKAAFSFFISEEDRSHAISSYGLLPELTDVIPYGIIPPKGYGEARRQLYEQFGLTGEVLFHFNGTMDYEPNMEAVGFLLNEVSPRLWKAGVSHSLLLTGKRLPPSLQEAVKRTPGALYLDFVPDINLVYQASDVFLNAVTNNSGVKTKLIEALANHCPVASTHSGAAGVPSHLYKEKLISTPDGDWDAFTDAAIRLARAPRYPTPPLFFEYFTWTNIAANAASHIKAVVTQHEGPRS